MKLSKHSKQRMREKAGLKSNEMMKMYKMAMKHGKRVAQIKDQTIKSYLAPKQKFNSRIVLYNDYVFVHSKNSKQLYTIYKLPKEMIKDEEDI